MPNGTSKAKPKPAASRSGSALKPPSPAEWNMLKKWMVAFKARDKPKPAPARPRPAPKLASVPRVSMLDGESLSRAKNYYHYAAHGAVGKLPHAPPPIGRSRAGKFVSVITTCHRSFSLAAGRHVMMSYNPNFPTAPLAFNEDVIANVLSSDTAALHRVGSSGPGSGIATNTNTTVIPLEGDPRLAASASANIPFQPGPGKWDVSVTVPFGGLADCMAFTDHPRVFGSSAGFTSSGDEGKSLEAASMVSFIPIASSASLASLPRDSVAGTTGIWSASIPITHRQPWDWYIAGSQIGGQPAVGDEGVVGSLIDSFRQGSGVCYVYNSGTTAVSINVSSHAYIHVGTSIGNINNSLGQPILDNTDVDRHVVIPTVVAMGTTDVVSHFKQGGVVPATAVPAHESFLHKAGGKIASAAKFVWKHRGEIAAFTKDAALFATSIKTGQADMAVYAASDAVERTQPQIQGRSTLTIMPPDA